MNNQTPFLIDIDALETELSELTPLVRHGFRQMGGPSQRVELAIRREALTRAGRKRSLWAWPLYRTFAAAAAVALLLVGVIQLSLASRASHNANAVSHILNIAATGSSAEHMAEGLDGLANQLLDIQGLDEDGFFKAEGAEALWL
jgi:hypothetical protein